MVDFEMIFVYRTVNKPFWSKKVYRGTKRRMKLKEVVAMQYKILVTYSTFFWVILPFTAL